MSSYGMNIPYPLPFDPDAAHEEERRRRAREGLDPSDVLAEGNVLV
jgi:hypothetical protein